MRQFRSDEAGVCAVEVHLKDGKMCKIVTSAEHASEILGATAAIPARIVLSRDRERLSVRQLADLRDATR